jgi:hypothetical protein
MERWRAGTKDLGTAGGRAIASGADGIDRWFVHGFQRTDALAPAADDRVIRSIRAPDPVSSIIDREGRRRSP